MTDSWTVTLRAINGAETVASVPVKDWFFNRVLNGPGAFEAKLNLKDSGVTEANYVAGGREIVVYRNGAREWAGYLTQITVDSPRPGANVTIRGEGYYGRLRRRLVMSDLIYTSVNQHQIAWNLINHTQGQSSGALGFTQGVHSGSVIARDRDYCAMDRPGIAEGIEEMSGQYDGYDFEIDPYGIFNTYNPRKQIASVASFDQNNTTAMSYEIDTGDLASMIVFQGEDDCNPPFGNVSDAAALTAYGLVQDSIDTGTDSWAESRQIARGELWTNRQPRWQSRIEWDPTNPTAVAWDDVDTGSLVTVSSNKGFATFTKTMRVLEIGSTFQPGFEANPRYYVLVDDAVDDL